MSDIERELSKVLVARADQAIAGGGSVEEVRFAARLRTRRRGVAGAGTLVVASALGIGALVARSPEPQRVTGAAGSANPVDPPTASFDVGADIWRCIGPAPLPGPEFVPPTTVAFSTTTVEFPGAFTSSPTFPRSIDNYYYMTGCEPVDNAAVETEVAAPSDSFASSTTEIPDGSTTEIPNVVEAIATSTTVQTATPFPCLIGSGPTSLTLDTICWSSLAQQSSPAELQIIFANISSYVEQVGGYELYTVIPGDYLFAIAQSFGLDAQRLADANGGSLDVILWPGHPLLIPLNG